MAEGVSQGRLTRISTHLQIIYQNGVVAFITAAKPSLPTGNFLPVTMALIDGSIKLNNIKINATLIKKDDFNFVPVAVTFLDDGTNGDVMANDGTFTSVIQSGAPGNYYLQAQVEGTASTGRLNRTCGLGFTVVPRTASITGNFAVRLCVGEPQ